MEKNTQYYDESEEILKSIYDNTFNNMQATRKFLIFQIAAKCYDGKLTKSEIISVIECLPAEYADYVIMAYQNEFVKSAEEVVSDLYDLQTDLYARDFVALMDSGKEQKQFFNIKSGQRLLTKYELIVVGEKFGIKMGDHFKKDLVIDNNYGKRIYELLQKFNEVRVMNKEYALIEKIIVEKLQESLQKVNDLITIKTEL